MSSLVVAPTTENSNAVTPSDEARSWWTAARSRRAAWSSSTTLEATSGRPLRTVLDVGAGADPIEIVEQIERRSSCIRCATPHELVALHSSGFGDGYAADCVWCLPTSYRPSRIAAVRFDDGWHLDVRLAHRLAHVAGRRADLRFDLDEPALRRAWAARWLELALPQLPDLGVVGPIERFDLSAARRLLARELHLTGPS